ncbi:hypothetical protein KBX49_07665 [Liquorilactobacillus satsumensis]|uniref:hypothetical protein n=1 Tax=Liquorilactobacillus satsumensis TaxID=259059 RepID=UPI0021C25BE0|nr:hypothetical protein [Liquorilactobacillus satsumensis]MCP9357974.1 hypothetical protein [Liquorilactobacillus satsumensis]MCP9371791.1 hypothetical protein [Liquorilactobacillus satsumensis]
MSPEQAIDLHIALAADEEQQHLFADGSSIQHDYKGDSIIHGEVYYIFEISGESQAVLAEDLPEYFAGMVEDMDTDDIVKMMQATETEYVEEEL